MSDEPEPEIIANYIVAATGGEYRITGATATLQGWKQLPDDHSIFAKIGRVAAGWSQLEHIFDELIWTLARVEPRLGASITAQIMGLGNRLDTVKALLTSYSFDSRVISKVESFKNNSMQAQESRNRIVHDPWMEEMTSKETAQFKAMPRKDLRYGIIPVSEAFVDETLSKIEERKNEAYKLNNLIRGEWKP